MNQTPPPMDAASLAEAFQAFARASDELTQAYNGLQGQVGELTERLTLLMAALPAGAPVLTGSPVVRPVVPVRAASSSMVNSSTVTSVIPRSIDTNIHTVPVLLAQSHVTRR